MKVLIVAGGERPSVQLLKELSEECHIVIGADKGCDYLAEANILPRYILGDFDSANLSKIERLIQEGAEKIEFSKEKDFTDSYSAVELAIREGATEIILVSVTGTRMDHTVVNFGLLLKALNNNVKAVIVDNNNKILMTKSNISLRRDEKFNYISFLAYGDKVEKLSINGAKYNINDYDLFLGDSRTISNEFDEEIIDVKLKQGTMIIIYSKD